ncbi:MAG: hypothetical protein DYG92_02005 [Leptolyngbya sp. PLA1]|nr:hypothetical protein [Leptolyngbya sp. PLA1]
MRRTPAQKLRALREYRKPREFDTGITHNIEKLSKEISKRHVSSGGLDTAIAEHAPAVVASGVTVQRVTPGGVATLVVSDAAAGYELDIWLRTGGMEILRANCKVALRRVRVVRG